MNEHISRILRHPATIPTVVGVISFAAGVGAGILFERRPKPEEVHENPDQLMLDFKSSDLESLKVIIDAQDYFQEPPPVDEPVINEEVIVLANPSVGSILAQAPMLSDIEVLSRIAEEEIPEELTVPDRYNAFESFGEGWDYEVELAQRTEDSPYVIHENEFHSNELGLTQISLLYYAGDDILLDDADVPIFDHHKVTGELKFGHGSGDPSVVYIRNPKNKAEYEVTKDDGMYSKVKLGLDFEDDTMNRDIKHSNHRRFRDED